MALFIPDGAVELYYNNSKKFETTSTGIQMSGDILIQDNHRIKAGASQDFEFYHLGGGDSYLDSNSGQLYIRSDQNIYIQPNDNENSVACNANGSVELFYDNSKKFETTSTGATVTGALTATSFIGNGSALTNLGVKVNDEPPT